MVTTVTGKNQVTIPAEMVKALDLKPGTRLNWSVGADPNTLIVKRELSRAELARQLCGLGKDLWPPGADPIQELIDERVRDDEEEELA
jgi:AbrB family looped-hinge helix DNA binding protein